MSLAIGAMKRYHEAQAAKLADSEIKRLRLDAKSLFQAVSDFQQRVRGGCEESSTDVVSYASPETDGLHEIGAVPLRFCRSASHCNISGWR